MEAKDLVLKARDEYIANSQDEQFKKAFEKVEALRVEADDEVKELKGYEPDDGLTNYVFNKLLEKARKEGGNVFMGDSSIMNEYIFEFYTDYDQLKTDDKSFSDNWSMYIRGVSNTPAKKKKEETSDTSKVDVEAIKKEAIKEYKEQEAKKKEEAKLKAEEEKKKKEEEAKRKEQEESESLGGLFDLL